MRAVADWWDGVELWLTQLWFPFQVALVIVVLLPLCWVCAHVIDRGVGHAAALRPRRRRP